MSQTSEEKDRILNKAEAAFFARISAPTSTFAIHGALRQHSFPSRALGEKKRAGCKRHTKSQNNANRHCFPMIRCD